MMVILTAFYIESMARGVIIFVNILVPHSLVHRLMMHAEVFRFCIFELLYCWRLYERRGGLA